jgi:hypothetical protein
MMWCGAAPDQSTEEISRELGKLQFFDRKIEEEERERETWTFSTPNNSSSALETQDVERGSF